MADLWITGDEMEQSFVRRQSTEPFSLFSVVAVCCLLLHITKMILFAILFPVAIVEDNCQLVHNMEGSVFSLFPVCYQILEAIWQSLIEMIA